MPLCRNKRVIKITIACIVMVIWSVCVYDVNARFSLYDRIVVKKNESVNINGLIVTPLKNKIYSSDEFIKLYPDCWEEYREIATADDIFVVYELEVDNITDDNIWFRYSAMDAFDKKTSISNNCSIIEPVGRTIVEAGDKITLKLAAYFYHERLTKTQIRGFKNENMALALSYYPEYITFEF